MFDYSKLADLVATALLAGAFASAARRCHTPGAQLWLWGWTMIGVHFLASVFLHLPGLTGKVALFVAVASLTWAAALFVRTSLPYRNEPSAFWMTAAFFSANTIYIAAVTLLPHGSPLLIPAAFLFGLLPLGTAAVSIPEFQHVLRWELVGANALLTAFLLLFQFRTENGSMLVLSAILFFSYLACFFVFLQACHEMTMGGFMTTFGFLAWSLVFVVSPLLHSFFKSIQVDSEIWNLPKYVVAAGMILLVLERQIEHNKYLALHDELTGLPNRRLFHDRLHATIERARRQGRSAALLLIDLDCFKQVNDSLGHHVGDSLLRQVGRIFSYRLRRSDTVARTGGDEFAAILEEPITRVDAERVARNLTDLIETPFLVEKHTVCIGASVGVAFYPEDGLTAESLCIAADKRMYDAKNGNRKAAFDSDVLLPSPASSSPLSISQHGLIAFPSATDS